MPFIKKQSRNDAVWSKTSSTPDYFTLLLRANQIAGISSDFKTDVTKADIRTPVFSS